MPTTVQIKEMTKQKLETLKNMKGLKTMDEVIEKMADNELGKPKSMFGKANISPWKKSDRLKLHGE